MLKEVLFTLMFFQAGNKRYGHVTGDFQESNWSQIGKSS